MRSLFIIFNFTLLIMVFSCDEGNENDFVYDVKGENPTLLTEETCPESDEVSAEIAPMRLLTRYEFDNTVRDLFGVNADYARSTFPLENASQGFENTPENTISDLSLRKILDASERIGEQHATQFSFDSMATFLRKAFRRPATQEEIDEFQEFYDEEKALSDETTAKQALIMAILLTPQFLYRIDLEDEGVAGELILNDGYKIANRLSYFLWGSMPDDILLDAAEADALGTEEAINAQVVRMLKDEKATDLVGEFYRQWLGLNALKTTRKDVEFYPTYNSALNQDYLESAMRFVKYIHFEGGGDVESLLTSDKLFLTPDLATALGEVGDPSMPISKPGQRAGILTSPALMALLSYPDQSSPIHRGIFVREKVLCQPLPAPPMDINISPPEIDPALTTRERFTQLTASSFCTSCHVRIDPLGFGFENYDAMGTYRAMDGGEVVDNSGDLSFTKDPSLAGNYEGGIELASRLAKATEAQECIGANWFQFAHGRKQTQKDTCETKRLLKTFSKDGAKFDELMSSIATSDAFRYRVLQGRNQ